VVGAALVAAGQAAYKAVMEPVEGTILTVVREAAEAAEAAEAEADPGSPASLVEVLEAAVAGARASLDRTPELLAVLANAGVVDAGGAGLVLLLDAMLTVVDGRPLPEPPPMAATAPASTEAGSAGAAGWRAHGDGDIGPRYEVMFFLEATDERVDAFKQAWAGVGESIAVVGGDGLWNCHIHSDDIGAAVEAGIEAGRPHQIRVTDLAEQVGEQCHPGGDDGAPQLVVASAGATAVTAVVAVGAGAGVARILRSLGATRVVSGGRSANPSTAEILAAVEEVDAAEVVLLTNDKNVVAVADQVSALTSKVVHVVPTRSVSEGFAALTGYDPGARGAGNAKSMSAAAASVVAGEVTHAVRDASTEAGAVSEGDWLGLAADRIVVVEADLAKALCALLDHLVDTDHELVTLLEGETADAGVTATATAWLTEHRPGAEVEVHRGGQPLSAYLVSSE